MAVDIVSNPPQVSRQVSVASSVAASRKTSVVSVGGYSLNGQHNSTSSGQDFAWLLERIADFASDPTPSSVTTTWRANETPPTPLQLLIPECVTFDAETGCSPTVLYFTDSGGYLRAARRCVQDEPRRVHQAIAKLAKCRYQSAKESAIKAEAAAALDNSNNDSIVGSPVGTTFAWGRKERIEADTVGSRGTMVAQDPIDCPRVNSAAVACPRAVSSDTMGRKKSCSLSVRSPEAQKRRTRATDKQTLDIPDNRFSWHLICKDGTDTGISDLEAENAFDPVRAKDLKSKVQGARLLQGCFWPCRERHSGSHLLLGLGCMEFSYKYDAFSPVGDVRLNIPKTSEQVSTSQIMDQLADRNLVSSIPVIFSQHLVFRCRLELVSGEFNFVRDHLQQVWLVDVSDLKVVPSVTQKQKNDWGDPSSPGGDGTSRKLNRYLSEEALNNLTLTGDESNKCSKMCEKMGIYFKAVKDVNGVDAYVQRAKEGMGVCIPVLEGMDKKLLARRFGTHVRAADAKKSGGENEDASEHQDVVGKPVKPQNQDRRGAASARASPMPPKSPKPETPRPRTRADEAARRKNELLSGAHPLWPTMPWTAPAPYSQPCSPESTALKKGRQMSRLSVSLCCPEDMLRCQSSTSNRRTLSFTMRGEDVASRLEKASKAPPPQKDQIEFTMSDETEKLISRTGLGLPPRGNTIDQIGPNSLQDSVGTGLHDKRNIVQNDQLVKLVRVPAGAAAKVVSAKLGFSQKSSDASTKPTSSLSQGRAQTHRGDAPPPMRQKAAHRRRTQSWSQLPDGDDDVLMDARVDQGGEPPKRSANYIDF